MGLRLKVGALTSEGRSAKVSSRHFRGRYCVSPLYKKARCITFLSFLLIHIEDSTFHHQPMTTRPGRHSPFLSREGNVLRAPQLESFTILNFYKRIFCFPLVKPYVLHRLENPHRFTLTANNVFGLTAYHRHIYWLILY